MAAETWGWEPDYGGQVETKPRIKSVVLGDGYEQSVSDGINTMPVVRSLVFSARGDAEVEAMEAFLRRHAGVRWFWFAYPGKAAIRVKCRGGWSVVPAGYGLNTLTCTFEQVFAVGV
jgi:phage-related protein